MIGLEDHQSLARDIDTARHAGARLRLACASAGIHVRTLQRWKTEEGLTRGDRRPDAVRPRPAHALTAEERAQVLEVASESTFHLLLREAGQTAHRGHAKAPVASRPPTTHIATAPRQVWCWDMTYLPATVAGRWFHLYLILDLYSRKIVGWEVHESDAAEHAAHLVRRTALAEGIASPG